MGLEEKQIKILFDKFNGDSNKGSLTFRKLRKSLKVLKVSALLDYES